MEKREYKIAVFLVAHVLNKKARYFQNTPDNTLKVIYTKDR